MVRQHHQFSGHEFKQTPGDSGGQKGLVCYSPKGHKEWDTTQQLNKNNIFKSSMFQVKSGFLVLQVLGFLFGVLNRLQQNIHTAKCTKQNWPEDSMNFHKVSTPGQPAGYTISRKSTTAAAQRHLVLPFRFFVLFFFCVVFENDLNRIKQHALF